MLEWTHNESGDCPNGDKCPGKDTCEYFPTKGDRIAMARAAYRAYAEADGTDLVDFVQDVERLAREEGLVQKVWVVTDGYKVEGVFATPDLAAPYMDQHASMPHSWFDVTPQKVVAE